MVIEATNGAGNLFTVNNLFTDPIIPLPPTLDAGDMIQNCVADSTGPAKSTPVQQSDGDDACTPLGQQNQGTGSWTIGGIKIPGTPIEVVIVIDHGSGGGNATNYAASPPAEDFFAAGTFSTTPVALSQIRVTNNTNVDFSATAVPEPGLAHGLMAGSFFAIAIAGRRRRG